MKIICAVKFVPDVDTIAGDIVTGRDVRRILNPDDACALAFALKVKAGNPGTFVEVVTMGPSAVRPHMEDLLRRDVDRGTLICDPVFEGSDSGVTGEILGRYIAARPFDCLLTGTHSLDGGAAHVPVQLAEILDMDQMAGIIRIDPERFDKTRAVFEAADEKGVTTYEMAMPGVLSLVRESGYKLPYAKLSDMRRDVSGELIVVTNRDLGFSDTEVGRKGSLTEVLEVCPKIYEEKDLQIVGNDDAGINLVFDFLRKKGVL